MFRVVKRSSVFNDLAHFWNGTNCGDHPIFDMSYSNWITYDKVKLSEGTFELKVPGYSKDDIKVEIDDDILSIECKSEKYGDMCYKYSSASKYDIDAELSNGILSIKCTSLNKQERKVVKIK